MLGSILKPLQKRINSTQVNSAMKENKQKPKVFHSQQELICIKPVCSSLTDTNEHDHDRHFNQDPNDSSQGSS